MEGTNPDNVRECYSRALRAVVEKGLDFHDCIEHTEGLELLGLVLSGDGRGHISNRRRWRLWSAIEHVLSRGFCTGHDLEVIMGHFTAMALIRREGLAVFQAGSIFASRHRHRYRRMWPAIRRELKWAQSFIPLLTCDLASPWTDSVYMADAAPWGCGIVTALSTGEQGTVT